jgi:hypothetical protein
MKSIIRNHASFNPELDKDIALAWKCDPVCDKVVLGRVELAGGRGEIPPGPLGLRIARASLNFALKNLPQDYEERPMKKAYKGPHSRAQRPQRPKKPIIG